MRRANPKKTPGYYSNFLRRRKTHCAKGRHFYAYLIYSFFHEEHKVFVGSLPSADHINKFCIWCEPIRYELLK